MGLIKTGISIAGKAAAAAASKVISDKVENFIEDEFGDGSSKTKPNKKKTNSTKNNSNLMKCPDCGELISKHATACPHCGCPVTKTSEEKVETKKEPKKIEPVETKEEIIETKTKVETKKSVSYPKEIKLHDNIKTMWMYLGFAIAISVFAGLTASLGYSSGDHSNGPIIVMIIFYSLAVIVAVIGIVLSIGNVKSFYIDELRIDVWDGVINKIAVNNKIVYRGFAKDFEFQLPNGSFVNVKFDGNNSFAEKIKK